MDCRTRFLRSAVMALGLFAAWGLQAQAAPLANLLSKKQEPKATPKAPTLVAFALCQEIDAEASALNSSQKQNLLDGARANYQKAVEVDPTHLPAYTGLARVYTNMNHNDKALETYHRALQKFPKTGSLWFDLALCHCRSKQWDLAIRCLQKSLELQPENRTVIQAQGFCEARAGHLQQSLQTLGKVMSPAEAYYTVARMLHHMKRDDDCRRYLGQALQLNPQLSAARNLQETLDRPLAQIHFEETRP
jgi:tetratricopeptide (TPR) repeat protein